MERSLTLDNGIKKAILNVVKLKNSINNQGKLNGSLYHNIY